MVLKTIDVSDKPLFDNYTSGINLSYYNFSNIFMWRNVMNYRYAIIDEKLCIFSQYRDELPFVFYPLGNGDITSVFNNIDFPILMKPLDDKMSENLKILFPDIQQELRSELSDYIYSTSDLANLSGKKFHKKRNHVNKFISSYKYEYVSNDIPLLKQAVDELFHEKVNQDFTDEYNATIELVNNFEKLDLKAGIILVDGNIAAYSIGEKQTPNTALIHIEKANRHYDGAYAIINYEFVRHEFMDTEYINREEDMGIEGLRQAKESYFPVAMNNVYSISFKSKEDIKLC